MNYIIVSVLAIVFGGIAALALPELTKKRDGTTLISKSLVMAAVLGILIINTFFSQVVVIGTGHVGIVRTFGNVASNDLLQSGAHFIMPWQDVVKYDNRTVTTTLAQPAEAASHDLQSIQTNLTVNWHISPEKLARVLQQFGLSGDGGQIVDKVVVPSILETFKSVISQYTAEELVTKRVEVSNSIADHLAKKMAQYDLVVETTNLTDFQFSQQFNAAIESKVTAEQDALRAAQVLKKVQIEAQQRVAQAKGEAEAIQIQAQAIKSQGGAEYVQLQAIHKWNGELPQYMMGNGSVPFINLKAGK